jgi:two-component system chemotaxis response regulator CheY
MKFLIVEDEFISRRLLHRFLEAFGTVEIAVDGEEAVDAVRQAIEADEPYQLISLDVLMPKMDGHQALMLIRELETKFNLPTAKRAKIMMATSLHDGKTVLSAFKEQCDGFLVKPVDKDKLRALLTEFGLIAK